MKTFDVPVLHGLARLNVNCADVPFHTPSQVMPAAHLRPVIRAQKLWRAALADDALQHAGDAPARHARIGFWREGKACKGSHDTGEPQPRPTRRHIAGKIIRPLLVGRRPARCCSVSSCEPLTTNAPHTEPGGTIYALHAFVVGVLSLTL